MTVRVSPGVVGTSSRTPAIDVVVLLALAGVVAGVVVLARAARVLVPLLDILQSIPVLGFLPGLVLGLVALFCPASGPA